MYAFGSSVFCTMVLGKQEIAAIESVLGNASLIDEATWLWSLHDRASGRVLAMTISTVPQAINANVEQGAMVCVVSVQTNHGNIELHDITGYLCIEPDEVMFLAKHGERFDSLVVGKSCTCSQYANIPSALLGADVMKLNPSLMMAALQLSLAESFIETLE